MWENTDQGLIVGGVKGQDGRGRVEDGERVDVDLDVAGARLGTCEEGRGGGRGHGPDGGPSRDARIRDLGSTRMIRQGHVTGMQAVHCACSGGRRAVLSQKRL